jgi:iron complex outermembrane recepter protein
MSETANSKKQGSILSNNLIRASISVTVVAALAAASAAAQAQQAPAAATTTDNSQIEEVIVTGTMIKRANAETAEAVTILKTDALKEQGVTTVEEALDTLTANNVSVNTAQTVGTTSGGGSFADLRGLGNGRTLVLLDGERLANNANTGNAVDLNGIPFSAIDNVQVLREGASALYGSDAIAGVINFITKKNYQGAEIQVNYDRPQEAGGDSGVADLTLGHGDLMSDGYNVMVTANYSRQNELQATGRSFSSYGFYPAGGYTATNNPGTWPGTFIDSNGNAWQSGYPACAGNPQLTTYFGNCAYRYSAATDLLPASHEISGMAALTKTLPGNNQVQLQYFYTQSAVLAYTGPTFYFFQMDPASPYYPTAAQLTCSGGAANCSTPTPDLAGGGDAVWSDPNNNRYNGNLNTEQRALLTFSGTNGGWDYTAQFNYSKNTNDNKVVSGTPNEAIMAPGGVLSDLINPFGPQSAAGQALINSAYDNGVYQVGTDSRWSADAHASHELGDAFNSGTPSTVAIGANVGGERFTNYTTPLNDLISAATGLTNTSVEGARLTQAFFMELDLPITKSLDLDLSDREDRYSDFGRTNNGKVSIRYQPLDILTFRATASTGFRAPTLYDLYEPNSLAASSSGTMGAGNPFCTPATYNAEWTEAVCNTQGIGLYGGNRNLTPETSQNFDLGVIVAPVQDLGITVDYFRILLKNTISAVPFSAIYGNPTGLANYIHTNDAGSLTPTVEEATYCVPYTAATCGYIDLTDENTGHITTDGIDLSVQYLQHTPIGTFHEDLEGTAVTEFEDQVYSSGPTLNLVGWFNELQPAFRWSHYFRVDWTSPNRIFGAGLSNRFYSEYIDQYPDGNGNIRHVGSYSLVDGFASVKPIENLTVIFGIKNILDRNPPFTNSYQGTFAAGFNSLEADPLGRNFYINVKYKIF